VSKITDSLFSSPCSNFVIYIILNIYYQAIVWRINQAGYEIYYIERGEQKENNRVRKCYLSGSCEKKKHKISRIETKINHMNQLFTKDVLNTPKIKKQIFYQESY